MDKFYTCSEISEIYQVKKSTVWEWIRVGRLKAFRVGKQYRIPKENLTEFEQKNVVNNKPQ